MLQQNRLGMGITVYQSHTLAMLLLILGCGCWRVSRGRRRMIDNLVKRLLNLKFKYGVMFWDYEVIDAAADRIEQLEELLELRDNFIVKQDLWNEFVASLEEKKDD
jgi:hypothetical protein